MNKEPTRTCYLGLGSNLMNPRQQLGAASKMLDALPKLKILAISPLYESEAMTLEGKEKHPNYTNAVVKCSVRYKLVELLARIKNIEAKMGRKQTAERWRARVIDIDILLVDVIVSTIPLLNIPHPGITARPFVLYPLRDIEPELRIRCGFSNGKFVYKSAAELAFEVKDEWNTIPVNE